MKELSIEEKAKAYDEAIERARTIVENKDASSVWKDWLHNTFPELKEPEDEKIRKEIKQLIQCMHDADPRKERWITWLEKQGEQKPVNDTDEDIVEAVKDTSILDMVEPKFHEGEWVVNDYCMGKVIELTADAYLLNTGQGIPFSCEHNAHLWTIQDAKDGDVLVSRYNKPFIYNGNRDSFHIGSYCGISVEDGFKVATEKFHWTENVNIHPATKEQRDLLFQKMHEAGYEWDADKKELSKRVIDEGKSEMDYCFTKMMNGEKVSPTWSEEDERICRAIICDIANDKAICRYELSKGICDEQINWLKSLKDRIGG